MARAGIKPLIFGGVLVFLGCTNIGFSMLTTGVVEPFYAMLTGFGCVLVVIGIRKIRRDQQSS